MTDHRDDEIEMLKAEIAALRREVAGGGDLIPKAAKQSLLLVGIVLALAGLAYLIILSQNPEDWMFPFFIFTSLALVTACMPLLQYWVEIEEAQKREQVAWEARNFDALEASRAGRQREAQAEAYETEAAMLEASARHAQAHARMAELDAIRAEKEEKEKEKPPPERKTHRTICTDCNRIGMAQKPGSPGGHALGWLHPGCSKCGSKAVFYDG
jgi:hypothetical protein